MLTFFQACVLTILQFCLMLISKKDPPRGPGLWKFNNSYLDEDEYINMMNDNLTGWLCDDSNL